MPLTACDLIYNFTTAQLNWTVDGSFLALRIPDLVFGYLRKDGFILKLAARERINTNTRRRRGYINYVQICEYAVSLWQRIVTYIVYMYSEPSTAPMSMVVYLVRPPWLRLANPIY